jgi:hypothetical protein
VQSSFHKPGWGGGGGGGPTKGDRHISRDGTSYPQGYKSLGAIVECHFCLGVLEPDWFQKEQLSVDVAHLFMPWDLFSCSVWSIFQTSVSGLVYLSRQGKRSW